MAIDLMKFYLVVGLLVSGRNEERRRVLVETGLTGMGVFLGLIPRSED